ncbi:hypothetical protein L195_g026982 [Trifolium pratense]|uniref:NAB domain-containing protein n=1 Tax=Trifolium pratense TaxID=57577 RepID=A0A2K3KXV9_TRIPR|nr:hypothetical protein L195_g026982 [Trifolium pratense]
MDAKVKAMIKLIEEDADSFARRAEMYYKKRPELMKLVEEFYRAYRALAERYNHATGELRQAHRTMAEPFMLSDDSPCSSSGPDGEPHTPEMLSFSNIRRVWRVLSEMEKELNKAQNVAEGLDERASKAEIEIGILKEALAELKSKKDSGLVQYNHCLERIANLEAMLSLAQLETKGHDERAVKAETEVKRLKEELARLEAKNDAGLLQYGKSLEKISFLETTINLAEENFRMLTEKIERAEFEVKALRQKLTELNEEKESVSVLYKQCLQTIFSMENEILVAHETSEWLKKEIELGAEKLKTAEKHCDTMEKSEIKSFSSARG